MRNILPSHFQESRSTLPVSDPNRILSLLGAIMALVATGTVTYVGVHLARSDFASIRGDEQYFVSGVVRLLAGHPLYTDSSDFPYCLVGYTPVAYYVTAWAVSLSGVVQGNLPAVMHAARTLALSLSLLHLLLLFLLLWRHFRVRLPIVLLTCAVVYAIRVPWGFVVRPDPLYSLLFLIGLGLGLMACSHPGKSGKSLLFAMAAGLVAGLLFLTKQTGVQLPIILLSFLLFTRDWHRLVSYSAGCLLSVTVAAIWMSWSCGPAWASGAFLLAHGGRISPSILKGLLERVMIREGGVVLIAAAIPAWISWMRSGAVTRYRLLTWMAVGSLAFSCVTVLSSGAAEHYFNDSLMLAVACAAVFWGSRDTAETKSHRLWLDGVVVGYCAMFLPFFISTSVLGYLKNDNHIENRLRVRAELQRRLNEHPNSFFLTVDNTLANFFPDRFAVPQMYYAAVFFEGGVIDFTKLQDGLNTGRVRWCLMGAEQDLGRQLGFLNLSASRFKKEETLDGFSIWTFQD